MSRYKLKQKWNKTKEKVTKDEVISQTGIGSIPKSIFSLSDNKLVKPKVQYEEMPFHKFKNTWLKEKENPYLYMKESTYWTELLTGMEKNITSRCFIL